MAEAAHRKGSTSSFAFLKLSLVQILALVLTLSMINPIGV